MMLVIYGPTATGKTNLAIKLAKKFNGELISADSRQVLRGLDIGTGKVSFDVKVEKHKGFWIVDGIKIRGFDLANPGEPFSVADFLYHTSASMIQITKANKLPIIVGGTGFYIKAFIDGINSIGIPADQKLRSKLEKLSAAELYQNLKELDRKRAELMNQSDRQNPRRLIRAIEIALHNQKQVAGKRKQSTRNHLPATNYLLIGLTAPNNFLYSKVDKWLQTRLDRGLIEEVRSLLDQGIDPDWLDNLGLEYRWLTRYLKGQVARDIAVERLKGDIHNFTRRQKTWFKQFKRIKLFDITEKNWQDKLEKTLHVCYTQNRDDGQGTS
ncbi:tRNA (adenosine(37)-N6)-dimethylallyltransferase MiaA [Candidatus Curtissbacteria bacterium]|nr:tRNA (adenosine(37)-N6)-dimethylallyltransferase MiaA [Candidatus Curtissbacteria bacterium]